LFEGIHSEAAVDVDVDGGNSRSKKRRRKQHSAGMFSIVSVAVLCLIGILHGGTGSISSFSGGNRESMDALNMQAPMALGGGRRARHMLSTRVETENVTQQQQEEDKEKKKKDESSQALALWSDILKLHENQSAVKPRINLNTLFHRLEVLKPSAEAVQAKQLRGTNRALVPWTNHGKKNTLDGALRSLSMLSQGVFSEVSSEVSSNSSIILCPRVYGSYNRSSSHGRSTDGSPGRGKLMLVLPSSALDSANYKENEGTWDGKWVEIDAVVTAVRPLMIKHPATAAPRVTAS